MLIEASITRKVQTKHQILNIKWFYYESGDAMTNWFTEAATLLRKVKTTSITFLNQIENKVDFHLELVYPFFRAMLSQQKSHEKSFNCHLDRLDLWFKLRPLLYGDWGSNDRAGHPTGPAQGLLGADKHIWDVLVLTEQWKMEDDLQWFSISSHHNKLSNASVQGFSSWRRNRLNYN